MPEDVDNGTAEVDVDRIIACICAGVAADNNRCMADVSATDIHLLCCAAREVLQAEGNTLQVPAPVNVLGDIHGQLPDLLRMMARTEGLPGEAFLFLGDYVDRGKWSLETITLLLAYKVKYPTRLFLLRGNHECASVNRIYGFYDDCKRKYSIKTWKTFTSVFGWMPLAAVIGGRVFCVHGGLSPELQTLDSIASVPRPVDPAGDRVICDILWSDPDRDITGWGENDRGVGTTFGPDAVRTFLASTGYELVCRAHQVVEDGYEFFAGRRLITLFSAPNYCGQFDNAAAMLRVGPDLLCRLEILQPEKLKPRPIVMKAP